tara:strand:- start:59 stop:202 length:144 start_codon:yes stop_codon:yes gene_type:complete
MFTKPFHIGYQMLGGIIFNFSEWAGSSTSSLIKNYNAVVIWVKKTPV